MACPANALLQEMALGLGGSQSVPAVLAVLRVLIVEDNPDDAELVVHELRRGGWRVVWQRVDTREQMSAALDQSSFDLIVSDYQMPNFRAPEALAVWRERGLECPFIVCSGTLGEEQAVEVLKAGAHDFFLKERLTRLSSAVARELREAEGRRTLHRAEQEREEAVRALGNSERLFQDLFESAPDATLIVDEHGYLRSANRQAKRLFGYDWIEMSTEPIELLVPALEERSVQPLLHELGSSAVPRVVGGGSEDVLARRKDGSTFPVEITLSPMTTESGVIVAVRDITDRRRLEEQLRQGQKMEAVGQLAGGVAHDFNNLLGLIQGHTQLLLKGLPHSGPLRARAEQVLLASERGASLTHQLLAFSRQQPVQPRALDLNAVIGGLTPMLGRLLGEDVSLESREGPALGIVRADPTAVEQILMNLAVNARDAMPRGGRLAIETANVDVDEARALEHSRAAGRYVCLTVTDTGHGMTREVQARVFEPFFTTKEPGRGTGLGLATIYRIVNQANGFIELDSEPGLGTTFRIFLPRVADELERPVAPEQVIAAPGTETLLLVEDDPSLRELVAELLQENGYTVIVCASAEEALSIVEEHAGVIHLLLTDVVMPGLNGRELGQRARERRPGLRILYMSGYTADIIATRTVLDPRIGFLSKPFTEQALTRRVREVLDTEPTALD